MKTFCVVRILTKKQENWQRTKLKDQQNWFEPVSKINRINFDLVALVIVVVMDRNFTYITHSS